MPPAGDPPPEAVVRQETMPALEARRTAAVARADARRAFFDGDESFEVAWTHLPADLLGREAALRGRLSQLDDAAIARAVERDTAPDGLSDDALVDLRRAIATTHDAEVAADGLERDLLTGVLARLGARPELTEEAVAAAVPAIPEPTVPDGEGADAARRFAADAALDRQRLAVLVRALRLGRSPPAPDEDLARLPDPQAAARLRLVAPLLDDTARAPVDAALAQWVAPEVAAPTAAEVRDEVRHAQDDADAARLSAADTRDRVRAEALADYAAARARSADAAESESAADAALTELRSVTDHLAELELAVTKVQEASALDPDRPDPDAVHADLRALLSDLHDRPAALQREVAAVEAARQALAREAADDLRRMTEARDLAAGPDDPLTLALKAWPAVNAEAARSIEARSAVVRQQRDRVLGTWTRAQHARRDVAPYVSASEGRRDRSFFLDDVRQEVSLLPSTLGLAARGRVATAWALPARLLDLNVWVALLASSFGAIVGGLSWGFARRQAEPWARSVAERVRKRRPELRPRDLLALRAPTAALVRSLIDLAFGPVLVWALGDALPEVRTVLWVWMFVAAYRVVLAAFELGVVGPTEVRPALIVLRQATYDLARSTLRWALGWFLARRVANELLWVGLGLDRIASAVDAAFGVVGLALVVWTAWRWEPVMRERLARHGEGGRATKWLVSGDGAGPLRVVRAVGQLGLLAAGIAVELGHLLAKEGTSLAWLYNVLGRYRLDEDEVEIRPLPDHVAKRLIDGGSNTRVERTELAEFREAVAEWKRERRRGLAALVGGRGSGKQVACDVIEAMIEDDDLTVTRAPMTGLIRGRTELLAWLCAATGVAANTDAEWIAAVRALPSKVWILEDAHRCFARRVGGLDAVSLLFYLLNATADRHFWILAVHGPTWSWWGSKASPFDTGVFHTTASLAPLTSQQLRELTLERSGRAGLRPDFSSLARGSAVLGGDPEIEEERQIALFYRLLADASNGSPSVAMALWAECLEPTDDPRVVRVRMSRALSLDVAADLKDPALFVLVAIDLHQVLAETEVAAVTNLPDAVLRATVRDLLSRGLLEQGDDGLRIPERQVPYVQRTLRRRHFLHLGAA